MIFPFFTSVDCKAGTVESSKPSSRVTIEETQPWAGSGGFTLIEVIVAAAVTTMTVTAVTSSVLASQRLAGASEFYPRAIAQANQLQAEQFGLIVEPDSSGDATVEDNTADWLVYRLEDHDRGITVAFRK